MMSEVYLRGGLRAERTADAIVRLKRILTCIDFLFFSHRVRVTSSTYVPDSLWHAWLSSSGL
jgi:hypothetical protein